jgi:hypothetical protein
MIVYKVVSRDRGKLYSAIMRGFLKVEYKQGEPVTALDDLSLMAFSTKKDAEGFLRSHMGIFSGPSRKLEVWECEAEKGKKQNLVQYTGLTRMRSLERIVRFIEDYGNKYGPTGTVFCKSITLKEKVE